MAAGDLVTLVDVKEYLGIKETATTDDSLLSKLITRASKVVANFCDTSIIQATFNEQRDGNDSIRLMLRQLPIVSVASLVIDGQNVPSGGSSLVRGFWHDELFVYVNGYRFNRRFSNVNIVYDAGYAVTPSDIESVCIDLVAIKYKRKDRIGLNSVAMNGQQTNYTQNDLSDDNKLILNDYKRVGLA